VRLIQLVISVANDFRKGAQPVYPEISCLLFSAFVPADLNNIYKTLMLNREWDVVHAEQAAK
jgi:hypothetical protein